MWQEAVSVRLASIVYMARPTPDWITEKRPGLKTKNKIYTLKQIIPNDQL